MGAPQPDPGGADDMHLAGELLQALSDSAFNTVLLGRDLRVDAMRWDQQRFDGLVVRRGMRLSDLIHPDDYEDVVTLLRKVEATGQSAVAADQPTWRLRTAAEDVWVRLTVVRSPHGLIVFISDHRQQEATERAQRLLEDSAARVGAGLDVDGTARQLAEVMAPLAADLCTVDLAEEVAAGQDPPRRIEVGNPLLRRDLLLRRAARAPADHAWPEGYAAPGELLPPFATTEVIRQYMAGLPFYCPSRAHATAAVNEDPDMIRKVVATPGPLTLLVIPLVTDSVGDEPGLLLGGAALWWLGGGHEVTEAELRLAQLVCKRAAVSLDNARRHLQSNNAVRRLHQLMLPGRVDARAAQTAARYAPATASSASGDWWDVVPLSSRRVAFIVGDVAGHGLEAAAMMGRLRVAARSFATLDQTPDELLTHLDKLVIALAAEHPMEGREGPLGSTCLVAFWDPVWRQLTVAAAGHLAPMLVSPDGHAVPVELDPGPPLGLGTEPFEVTTLFDVPSGSTLVMCTDGLIHDRNRPDIQIGLDALAESLAGLHEGDDLDARAELLMQQAAGADDDATVLLARLSSIDAEHTAAWDLPAEGSEVATARRCTEDCLRGWGAGDDLVEVAVLIVSELVTNAIRYGPHGAETVGLRLICDAPTALIIEVSDGASTAPMLRRAKPRDEGRRGLMIVARYSNAEWGTRYRDRDRDRDAPGKTVWVSVNWAKPPTPQPPAIDPNDFLNAADD